METREIFVLEENGKPVKCSTAEYGAKELLLAVEAGVRMGRPVGEERVVRYIPEPEQMWLFQANDNWTETQISSTGPLQPLLLVDTDDVKYPFKLYFMAQNFEEAKRLMDVFQGHRAGTYVESVVPGPPSLKERKPGSKYVPGRPKHRWKEAGFKVSTLDGLILDHDLPDGAEFLYGKVCKRCGQIKRIVRYPKLRKCQSQYRHSTGIWFFGNQICVRTEEK